MSTTPGELNAPAAGKRRRSLRVRVGLVVGGALILLFAIFTIISALVTGYFFAELQDHFTENKIERVARMLDQLGLAKSRLVRDSAEWNETFDYIEGRNPGYLASNFAPAVNSSGQDIVLIFDSKRKLLGTVQTRDYTSPYEPPDGLDLTALSGGGLLDAEAAAGVVATKAGVLLLAACPVRRSDLSGMSNGWLVFGTYFTPERIEEVGLTAGANVTLSPAKKGETPTEGRRLVLDTKSLGPVAAFYTPVSAWWGGEPSSNARMVLKSLTDSPDVLVEMGANLVVYAHALQARNWFLIVSAIFGLTIVGMSLAIVEWSVLRPLAALDRELGEMSRAKGDIGQLKIGRDDEIGRLAKSANRLLERVLSGQREALKQEELLSGVLDSAHEGVVAYHCVRDISGEVVDLRMALVNHSGEKMLHVAEGEIIGKTIKETYPRLVESGAFDQLVRAAATREAATFETYYKGHRIAGWYRYSVAPWGDGVVMTFTDISERKIREHELAASLVELERFNAAMIGREERILEMKREVNMLRRQLGQPETYEVNSGET